MADARKTFLRGASKGSTLVLPLHRIWMNDTAVGRGGAFDTPYEMNIFC